MPIFLVKSSGDDADCGVAFLLDPHGTPVTALWDFSQMLELLEAVGARDGRVRFCAGSLLIVFDDDATAAESAPEAPEPAA